VSCPTRYFAEASSINFKRSIKYGFGVLHTTLKFFRQQHGLGRFPIFDPHARKLSDSALTQEMEAALAKEARA
jgi:hypothetical protein